MIYCYYLSNHQSFTLHRYTRVPPLYYHIYLLLVLIYAIVMTIFYMTLLFFLSLLLFQNLPPLKSVYVRYALLLYNVMHIFPAYVLR